ncbi:hypothetical protein [Streptomyces sp. NPDC058545]|uniref:hypothetical protein n=1 Tax=Streptomyces sp. NPDC058545 TaxID=3346544 RepID=UPI003653CD87
MRTHVGIAAVVTAGTLAALTALPAQGAEYSSALKVRGIQYDAPGPDSNKCSSGNTREEYLTVRRLLRTRILGGAINEYCYAA